MNEQKKQVPYLTCKFDPVIAMILEEQQKNIQKSKQKKAKVRKLKEKEEAQTPIPSYFVRHDLD
jgi:hypothetical protein